MSKQPDIDELIRQGFELLEVEDFQGAIKVGKQLQTKRHTSAFEILALAHAGLGNAQRAVVVLEEGIRRGPDVWLLWQLLGNCRSDLGLYDVAHEAYESALKCPGVNASSVHLNAAIALSRQKRLDEAMARLDLVEDNELQPRVEAQRLYIFNERREYEAAIRLAEPLFPGLKRSPMAKSCRRYRHALGTRTGSVARTSRGQSNLQRRPSFTIALPRTLCG